MPRLVLSDCPVFLPTNLKNLPVPPKSTLNEAPATWSFFDSEPKKVVRTATSGLSEALLRMLRSPYLMIKASLAKADLNEPLGMFTHLFSVKKVIFWIYYSKCVLVETVKFFLIKACYHRYRIRSSMCC